jgi:hypothetical protein
MPYIKDKKRMILNHDIESLVETIKDNSQMAYVIYKLIKVYYARPPWDDMSDALKVLEDVKLEYYRRVMVPYTDKKIAENGDV